MISSVAIYKQKTMRLPTKIKNVVQVEKTDKKNVKIVQPLKHAHVLFIKQQELQKTKEGITTSKLEYYFAEHFLKKLGLRFVHQWTSIKTKFVYDFAILTPDGGDIQGLIECDGDYWHANPVLIEKQGFLYENQKRQIERDKAKNEWAALNGFVLIRFFENDIKNSPKKILGELKRRFYSTITL
jgi:very-short-patch-repair endonuclease